MVKILSLQVSLAFSIFIPIFALIVGLVSTPAVLAASMMAIEAVFAVCLFLECRKMGC